MMSHLLNTIFHIVLMTSSYAAVVGLVILLLKSVLNNRLDARWHYLIWVVLILKLLVPFGPESSVSIFNAVPEITQPGVPQVNHVMEQQIAIAPADESPQPGEKPIPTRTGTKPLALVAYLLPYIWVTGTILMLLWLGVTYISLYLRLRKSSLTADARISGIFASCQTRMGVKSNLDVVIQNTIAVPSLFGILRPRILLTPAAASLSDQELQYVLLHEMAHYKRKDALANCLLLVLQSIHWFNPVIWYCFRRMRQDMEVATDERVLSVLENTEHRDYGRALLTALEGFTPSNLAPRLLGMVDDQNNMERRLRMIKLADFFQKRRKPVLLVGVVCLVVLGAVLLTSATNKPQPVAGSTLTYDASTLIKYKTDYVGDNSKVVNLIDQLPLASSRKEVSLQTGTAPYGITIHYDFRNAGVDQQRIKRNLRDNAAVMFALIKNVDMITYNAKMPESTGSSTFQCSRIEIQNDFPGDLWGYSKNVGRLDSFLKNLTFKVWVFPKQYTLTMSSTPGIRLLAQYEGQASKVRYSTEHGLLFTSTASGKSGALEVAYGNPVYWSPLEQNGQNTSDPNVEIKVAILDPKGQTLDEKKAFIIYDDRFYTVARSSSIVYGVEPADLNDVVSQAIKGQGMTYLEGETSTEGHIILDTEEQNGTVKVYAIASAGNFGFENGVFTKISGSGAIPTVITLSRKNGEYTLLEYKEPMDGSGYTDSIKKMFPRRFWDRVLSDHGDYAALKKQEENQAREYLKQIGRSATVSADHVEKRLPEINAEASNKLFAEYTKQDAFLNNCPYWIGTRECIENGERIVYETSQSKISDGYDLITFKKTKANGTVLQERRYKIVGSEVRTLLGESAR
jgi:bla regulator protein BlaR1